MSTIEQQGPDIVSLTPEKPETPRSTDTTVLIDTEGFSPEEQEQDDSIASGSLRWDIPSFSTLPSVPLSSGTAKTHDAQWKVVLYAKGIHGHGKRVSAFIAIDNSDYLGPLWSVRARFLIEFVNRRNPQATYAHCTEHVFSVEASDWGFADLAPLQDLLDPEMGFLDEKGGVTLMATFWRLPDLPNPSSLPVSPFHPQSEQEELLMVHGRHAGNRGIGKAGANGCLSCVLQMLFHITAFSDFILSGETFDDPLLVAVQKLYFTMMFPNSRAAANGEDFLKIKEEERPDIPQFTDSTSDIDGIVMKLFKALDDDKVRDIFQGTVRKTETNQKENFISLPIPMSQTQRASWNIYDGLTRLTNMKKQHLLFEYLPSVLILNPQRFIIDPKDGSQFKMCGRMEFPLVLELSSYYDFEDELHGETVYDLFGIIVHKGESPKGGKFEAFIRNTSPCPQTPLTVRLTPRWLRYDGEGNVHDVKFIDVLAESFGGKTSKKDDTFVFNAPDGKCITVPIAANSSAVSLFYAQRPYFAHTFYRITPMNLPHALFTNFSDLLPVGFRISDLSYKQDSLSPDSSLVVTPEESPNGTPCTSPRVVSAKPETKEDMTNINVFFVTEKNLREYRDGEDLVNFSTITPVKMPRTTTFNELYAHAATLAFPGAKKHDVRLYAFVERQNGTLRPTDEVKMSNTTLAAVQREGKFEVYVHVVGQERIPGINALDTSARGPTSKSPFEALTSSSSGSSLTASGLSSSGIQTSPSKSTPSTVLLFFKLYDPKRGTLTYLGNHMFNMTDMCAHILDVLRTMSGLTDCHIAAYEELCVSKMQILSIVSDWTLVDADLETGDIIVVQKLLDDYDVLQVPYPTMQHFYMRRVNLCKVRFIPHHSTAIPNVRIVNCNHSSISDSSPSPSASPSASSLKSAPPEGFVLELPCLCPYEEVQQEIAKVLNVVPSHIRFTAHNYKTGQPSNTPFSPQEEPNLADMLTALRPMGISLSSTNPKHRNLLYFEVLDVPAIEADKQHEVLLRYFTENAQPTSEVYLMRTEKTSTIKDVLQGFKKEFTAVHAKNGVKLHKVRLLEVYEGRITRDFAPSLPVTALQSVESGVEYRIEQESSEEARFNPATSRMVQVAHFTRDYTGNAAFFGVPFYIVLPKDVTVIQAKVMIQAKLSASSTKIDLNSFKLARIEHMHPTILDEDDEDDDEEPERVFSSVKSETGESGDQGNNEHTTILGILHTHIKKRKN